MSAYDKFLEEYEKGRMAPADIKALADLMVADSSVQDGAVTAAVKNAQDVAEANGTAFEKYLAAIDAEEKAADAEAINRASHRLDTIEQQITMYGTMAGKSKEGKRQLARLISEREQILEKFPMLGMKGEAGGSEEEGPVDFDEILAGDEDEWREYIHKNDLPDFANLVNYRLGRLPEGFSAMLSYKISNSPELSKRIKLDQNLTPLRPFLGTTLGDLKKQDADAKAAAKKKAYDAEVAKATEIAKSLQDPVNGAIAWGNLDMEERRIVEDHLNEIPSDLREGVKVMLED